MDASIDFKNRSQNSIRKEKYSGVRNASPICGVIRNLLFICATQRIEFENCCSMKDEIYDLSEARFPSVIFDCPIFLAYTRFH